MWPNYTYRRHIITNNTFYEVRQVLVNISLAAKNIRLVMKLVLKSTGLPVETNIEDL